MKSELRCDHKLHGIIVDGDNLEVKCSSAFCGAGAGTVVFHYFSISTGELTSTKKYQDPSKIAVAKKEAPK